MNPELGNIEIAVLRKGMAAAALLEQKMGCEDYLRAFQYEDKWGDGVSMAKFDNGSGDHFFILFCESGAIIKGFEHESPVSPHARDDLSVWPGMYDTAPEGLLSLLDDPAIEKEMVTFCFWRRSSDSEWIRGPVSFPNGEDDGASLLWNIPTTPDEYSDWASLYYEDDFRILTPMDIAEAYK